jgi:CTP:molybdopterin cytidylyltransferase MocA
MTKTKNQKPQTNDVAAIILAAGRSQRMGAFKPLLPFGPQTVIETCIENIRGGGVQAVVVVVGQGQQANELKVHLLNSSVIFAINPDPESEMSASISCGVRALPEEKPTCNEQGGHPVLIDLVYRDELLSLPAGGLKTLFGEHQEEVSRVSVNSNYIARDMDTWDDYSALHQEVFGVPAPELPARNRA